MDTLIPNHQLALAWIPVPDGDLQACAELANHNTALTLTELRCALFFEARRDRHSGGLSDVQPAVRRHLRAIRARCPARSWDESLGPAWGAALGALEPLADHWPAGQSRLSFARTSGMTRLLRPHCKSTPPERHVPEQ